MTDGDHSQLLELERATLEDVAQYAQCSLADKARVQKLSLAIQDKLAKIRGFTRDLELLVEEVDRQGGRPQCRFTSLLACLRHCLIGRRRRCSTCCLSRWLHKAVQPDLAGLTSCGTLCVSNCPLLQVCHPHASA